MYLGAGTGEVGGRELCPRGWRRAEHLYQPVRKSQGAGAAQGMRLDPASGKSSGQGEEAPLDFSGRNSRSPCRSDRTSQAEGTVGTKALG